MRAQYEHLKKREFASPSFLCYKIDVSHFKFKWHYHPELELTYIIKGKGKRLIGNQYEIFDKGDFVLLGPNLPHTWVSEKVASQRSQALVIQFPIELIESLLQLPEFKSISKLIRNSSDGICFRGGKATNQALEKAFQLLNLSEADYVLGLIQVLQMLSRSPSASIIKHPFAVSTDKLTEKRINTVFQFVLSNYKTTNLLSKAAASIHLSKSAFCKFFKRVSGTTFSNYANEIRVDCASTLLIETDRPISIVATESGFENLAYFNRVFLSKKRITPRKFRMISDTQRHP